MMKEMVSEQNFRRALYAAVGTFIAVLIMGALEANGP